jgi:hypothetical protein
VGVTTVVSVSESRCDPSGRMIVNSPITVVPSPLTLSPINVCSATETVDVLVRFSPVTVTVVPATDAVVIRGVCAALRAGANRIAATAVILTTLIGGMVLL